GQAAWGSAATRSDARICRSCAPGRGRRREAHPDGVRRACALHTRTGREVRAASSVPRSRSSSGVAGAAAPHARTLKRRPRGRAQGRHRLTAPGARSGVRAAPLLLSTRFGASGRAEAGMDSWRAAAVVAFALVAIWRAFAAIALALASDPPALALVSVAGQAAAAGFAALAIARRRAAGARLALA